MTLDLRSIARMLGGDVSSDQVNAPGPGHSKADRSLSIRLSPTSPDGFIVHSHADDDWRECRDYVRAALGLPQDGRSWKRDRPPKDGKAKAAPGPIKAVYDYVDENGARLFQSLRYEPVGSDKTFRQRTGPDQEKWSIEGVRVVPYRLPELIEALALGHTVFVVEGEKDVETLRALNIPATTNPMGAGKWRPEFNKTFRGGDVVICGDNDEPGRDHVKLVAGNLYGVARRVRVLDLEQFWPAIPEGGDITDWFDCGGGSAERLYAIVEQLTDWQRPNGEDRSPAEPGLAYSLTWDGEAAVETKVPELIEGMLPQIGVALLSGQWGLFKTFTAIDLAFSVMTMTPFAGRNTLRQGGVLFIAAEGAKYIPGRLLGVKRPKRQTKPLKARRQCRKSECPSRGPNLVRSSPMTKPYPLSSRPRKRPSPNSKGDSICRWR